MMQQPESQFAMPQNEPLPSCQPTNCQPTNCQPTDYQPIEDRQTVELQVLNQFASTLLEQKNWDAAVTAYQELLSQYPEFDWGYHHLAFALSQLDRLQEADAVYEQLARLKPTFWAINRNHIQVQQQLSDYLFRQQDWLRAAKAYRWTIELNPTIARNYLKLGQTLLATGQWQDAEIVLHQAIHQEPNLADAYGYLGDLHLHQEEIPDSIAAYEKAIALNSERRDIQEKLAVLRNLPQTTLSLNQQQPQNLSCLDAASNTGTDAGINSASDAGINLTSDAGINSASDADTDANPVHAGVSGKISQSQISIFVSPQLLQELYAATPKLFVAAIDAAAVEVLQPSNNIDFYQFSWNEATQTGTIASLALTSGSKYRQTAALPIPLNQSVELLWIPMFCQGFLISTPEGRSQLKPLMDWWLAQGKTETPPVIDLSSITNPLGRKAEFWKILFGQTVTETARLGHRLSTLQTQYLELRSLHETVQNAFAAVENFLSQVKLPSLQLTFATHPTQQALAQEPGTSNSQLQQLLPLPSRGLAAIEFHVAASYPHAEGMLRVKIYSPDDETELACWQIPYAHLTPGWFQLDLPGIDLGRKRDVHLQVDWQTRLGPAPSISLSDRQSVPEAQVQMNQVPLDRSLALRLWTGLPGSRRNYSPYLTLSNAIDPTEQSFSGNPSRSGNLGQRAMARVVEVTPNLPTENLAYIRVLDEGQKILTHARSSGVTVAMLPFGFAAGATQIRATVETQDEKAGTLEYAIGLVKDSHSALSCFTEDSVAVAFSGWTPIPPNTPHQLTLTLPEPIGEPCHIIFGTRTPVGGNNAYGWACWLNFHVDYPS